LSGVPLAKSKSSREQLLPRTRSGHSYIGFAKGPGSHLADTVRQSAHGDSPEPLDIAGLGSFWLDCASEPRNRAAL